jgi:prepilin-type N-terminal cleavage/methylation domain-containing protein
MLRIPSAAERRDDSGVSFIELLVAMVLFGILVAISAGPYARYRVGQEHIGSTRELVAFLRRAQVRAVSEETTYRIDFASDGSRATAYRFNGTTYVAGQVISPANTRITYSNVTFAQPDGSGTGLKLWFYARGSAGRGSVTVAREGAGKTYSVNVEGLTARVSYE